MTRGGMPVGYEVFDGNRNDVTTVKEIVGTMENRHGEANRIWVMDRGMASEENIEFLKSGGRRYIIGASKTLLKKHERELLNDDWMKVHEGVEVKICAAPEGDEVFVICKSEGRREKEKAICGCDRCGASGMIGCGRTFWFVSWRSRYGKRSPRCVAKSVSATSRAE